MEDKKDAFGRALMSYYRGERGSFVVERDDDHVECANAESYFQGYGEWPERVKEAMEYVKGKVLDIGCGAGRHSLYLQEQGHEVVGMDNSPLCIKVCQERGLENAKALPIEDVDKLGKDSFDTILMLGVNFGLLHGPEQAPEILGKLDRITKEDGKIITESQDPYDTEDEMHKSYHEMNRERGRMPGQLRLRVRFRKYKTGWFDYLNVSKEEMKEILRNTYWGVEKFIDADDNDSKYIAIIEKVR